MCPGHMYSTEYFDWSSTAFWSATDVTPSACGRDRSSIFFMCDVVEKRKSLFPTDSARMPEHTRDRQVVATRRFQFLWYTDHYDVHSIRPAFSYCGCTKGTVNAFFSLFLKIFTLGHDKQLSTLMFPWTLFKRDPSKRLHDDEFVLAFLIL